MKKFFYFFLILIISCSSTNDKKNFEEGLKYYNEKNYNEAYNKFQQVISDNSTGQFREKSLMMLGTMYYMYQVPNTEQTESNQKAVEFFRLLFKEFPNSKDAPKALFLSGYILANHLNKLDEAKLAYQEFLNKFPSNEFASSVKIELDNLGKTPDEILQKNLTNK